jgi:regulator of sigma E protease
VKVLRFALGFGPTIWKRPYGRDGTEWAVAALPLGGYVKMLDEREGAVEAHELARAFNRQPVGRRAFIVVAGPVANLFLAVLLYWVLFMYGIVEFKPRLGAPPVGTPAASVGVIEGSTVRAVNGASIASWQDLRWEVLRQVMNQEALRIEATGRHHEVMTYRIGSDSYALADMEKDPLSPLGLVLFRPPVPAVIGRVQPGSAADEAGFLPDDRVIRIGGKVITSWVDVSSTVRASAGQRLQFDIERRGAPLDALAAEQQELGKGDQIHQPVPAHRKRAKRKGNGVELGMKKHRGGRVG